MIEKFTDIKGHEDTLGLLRTLVGKGHFPQGVMLVGPAGIGKAAIGQVLAFALLCHELDPETQNPCGVCPSCRKLRAGSHQDFFHLQPSPNTIPVDAVRQTLEALRYSPVESERRFLLLEAADAMRPESMNAMLKVLEEPPPGSVFCLTTSEPGLVLPTIHSRLVKLKLGNLKLDDACAVLGLEPQETENLSLLYEAAGRQVGRLSALLQSTEAQEIPEQVRAAASALPGLRTIAQAMEVKDSFTAAYEAWTAIVRQVEENKEGEEGEGGERAVMRVRQMAMLSFLAMIERVLITTPGGLSISPYVAAIRDDARQPLREDLVLLTIAVLPLAPKAARALWRDHQLMEAF